MKVFVRIRYEYTEFEEHFEYEKFPLLIGRDPASHCVLSDESVSRKHAEIRDMGDRLELFDLGSRNGVYFEGKRKDHVAIQEGTHLALGAVQLSFSYQGFALETTKDFLPTNHDSLNPRISSLLSLSYFNQGAAKNVAVLFSVLLVLVFLSAPNHFKSVDLVKSVSSHVFWSTLLPPFLLWIAMVIVRKLNRGEYAWLRNLSYALLVFVVIHVMELCESFFCWFDSFEWVWSSLVFSFLALVAFSYVWIIAVGRTQSVLTALKKAMLISGFVYSILGASYLLNTQYKPNYDIQSCMSVTGWHWSSDKKISDWQNWAKEAALDLEEAR